VLTRRAFLAGGTTGLLAAGSGTVLAGCGQQGGKTGSGPPPVPGPERPVRWPVRSSNPAIRDGLRAERGATLRVLCWTGYVSPALIARFAHRQRCQVELTRFATMSAGVARLARPDASYDVVLGVSVGGLRTLLRDELLQPLNHSYLPRLRGVWPNLLSPFYDLGSVYTVPYSTRSTGIGWRKDKVPENPYELVNGWNFPWQRRYHGKVGILNDYREGLSLGLLSIGNLDLTTADPRELDTAAAALSQLAAETAMTIGNDGADRLASGRAWIHQVWSGQAVTALRLLPAGIPAGVIGYWIPRDGLAPVSTDTMVVPRRAGNPVLAHLLLNFLLEPASALETFRTTGYVQPLRWLTRDRLLAHGLLPPGLIPAATQPSTIHRGLRELPVARATDQLWHQVWAGVHG
jgi:spermidine/putrescine transport system substrate-binding protein